MKKLFSMVLGLFMFLLSFSQSKKEAELWSRVEALSKAVFDTKDSNALNDLVSSRVTYGHSGGNVEDKTTMVQKAVASKTIYKNPEIEKLNVDVEGKTAIVRHTFRAISVENNTDTPLNLAILQVWKKESGKWRLWARQAVKIPPKS